MALNEGDVLQFTVYQNPGTNPVLNVFHYEVINVGGVVPSYEEVAQAFWDYVKTPWRAFVSNGFAEWFDRVVVDNVTNEVDFGIYTIEGAERQGTRTSSGDYMGLMVAAALRLNVGTRLTRPGQKRFAPLYEGDQSNGNIVSGMQTLLAGIGDKLDENIGFGTLLSSEMRPVIYGLPNADRPSPVVNPIVSTTPVALMTTQRTRRR